MPHEHPAVIRRFIRFLQAFYCLFYREGGNGRTDEVDNDAWYDFYIGICRLPGENQPCQLDSSITFTVVNSDADDNECMYGIELTADERSVVLDILNSQCRKYMNKTCDELLNEAEEEMMDTE